LHYSLFLRILAKDLFKFRPITQALAASDTDRTASGPEICFMNPLRLLSDLSQASHNGADTSSGQVLKREYNL
jgi:hypothetical protein